MEITTGTVNKITIPKPKGLDPITVFYENFGKAQGRITIICYNKVWTSFWGSMGGQNILEFFNSCDEGYIAKNLSDINSEIPDWDKISEDLGEDVSQENHMMYYGEAVEKYGNPPEMPMIKNHNYEYLCRIIRAVQEAVK